MPERGPTRVTCTCGSAYTDINEVEAYELFRRHIVDMAEQDDLLHFRADVETVSSHGTEELTAEERLFAMSDDIARQLHKRNFGGDWTSREEADLLMQMLSFVTEKNHVAYHKDDKDDTDDWKNCRRITCLYVSVGLQPRRSPT